MDCRLCGNAIPDDDSFVMVAEERWRTTSTSRERDLDPDTAECYHLHCFHWLMPQLATAER